MLESLDEPLGSSSLDRVVKGDHLCRDGHAEVASETM